MRQRLPLYVLVAATASLLLGAQAASAQRSSSFIVQGAVWSAPLHGRNAWPAIRGRTVILESPDQRTISVRLRHALRLSGRLLTVYVGGRLAGHMRVGTSGRAHLYHDTNRGQRVPGPRIGHYWVKVRNARGIVVASGRLRLQNAP